MALLAHFGASVNRADHEGRTPLFACAESSVSVERGLGFDAVRETLQGLLEARAEPNLGCNDGATPVWMCAQVGAVAAMRLLVAAKGDVNQVTKGSGSALGYPLGMRSLPSFPTRFFFPPLSPSPRVLPPASREVTPVGCAQP